MNKWILLVDDERELLDLLEEVLQREGFRHIRRAETGRAAIQSCREHAPDAIVLDVMLPDMDGFEVCRQIRAFCDAPILFLSSRSDEIDKILGLAIGGDDYVTKPFSPREMAYRLKAQMRRAFACHGAAGQSPKSIHIGALRIDPDAGRVCKDGEEVALTAREYGLLLFLGEHPNQIISKERLYEEVWGEDSYGGDNTVMVHIRHLREKIEDDPSAPVRIVTVKGLGYKMVREDG